MNRLVIHIGLARTGTTTLQKEIFKLTKTTICLSKYPYSPSSRAGKTSLLMNSHDPRYEKYTTPAQQLYDEIFVCSVKLSIDRNRLKFQRRLKEALLNASKMADHSQKQLLFSTERLADTSTSLVGNSTKNPNSETEFPIYPLCDFAFQSSQITPSITVCMREPIKYL